MNKMKIAVLGCGNISDAYISSMISKFKILDVTACCDLNEEKMMQTAEKYGIKPMTLEAIIGDASIELVVNLTPSPAHYSLTKKLLEAGKHVYSEKVLALTSDQGKELLQIADDKGLYLGVAPDTFLGSAIQTAKYAVDSGMIGQVTSFYGALTRDITYGANYADITIKPGGGIAFDVGIYYITALLAILGPVSGLTGIMDTVNPDREYEAVEKMGQAYTIQNETRASAVLKFRSGPVGTLNFDATSIFIVPEQPALVINGSLGHIQMADPNKFGGQVKVMLKGNNEAFVLSSSHPFEDESRGLGVAEMAWAIRNKRKNRASKEMAYHALEALHGIRISSETGAYYTMTSDFQKPEPLPRGYKGGAYFGFMDETALAK